MGFFENYIGYNTANFVTNIEEVGKPTTASSTIQDVSDRNSRVPRKELERLFITDAQTFKIVTAYKQLLLQAGYKISAINKTSQKQYDDFFNELGKIGMGYKLEQLLGRIIHDCVLYGYSYVERVYDVTGTRIVDLKPIDAKLMDYAKDSNGLIVTDRLQRPVGFTMNVGYYSNTKGDPLPAGVKLNSGQIFLDKKRIACFIINPYSNGFEGVGMIEPAYTQITRKIKVEDAASNSIYNSADSLIYAIVGDANRSASAPLMTSTLDTLKKWTTNRRAVFPYPTQVNAMDVAQSPQVNEILKYLRQEQATAGGMSLSMAVGSGESNNKSTMNTERRDFNTRLNALADEISTQFNSQILDYLYDINNYGSKAKLIWNEISVEDRSGMIAYLKTLYDIKAISPEEIRKYARDVMFLETDDNAWKKFFEDKSPENTPKSNPLLAEKNIQNSKDNYEEIRQ